MQLKKLHCALLTLLAIFALSGCESQDEKSRYYYLTHPEELAADFKYCQQHPSRGICNNIVKKYVWYQNMTGNRPSKRVFADLDDPLDIDANIDKVL